MPSIGPTELVIVVALALLVLGPRRLPEVGRSLGNGMREFKSAFTGATVLPKDAEQPERD